MAGFSWDPADVLTLYVGSMLVGLSVGAVAALLRGLRWGRG